MPPNDMGSDFHEISGWKDADGTDLNDAEEREALKDAPQPQLWRILVRPKTPKRRSAGGIMLASQAQDAEAHLQYVGRVVAMGPLAGKSDRYAADGQSTYDVQVGDWIAYGRYAGQRLVHRGLRLLVINDDEVLCKVPAPEQLKVYV